MKQVLLFAAALAVLASVVVSCGNRSTATGKGPGGDPQGADHPGIARPQADADSTAIPGEAKDSKDSIKVEKKLSDLAEEPVFDITTNYGVIKVKLYKGTPLHRANFAKLAMNGFYDGLLFHRVINGFMIQAGDPLTKDPANADMFGTGGPGYTVPAEFVPEYRHKKGAIAAARRGDAANPKKEATGSQFYIVQNEMACAQLDGQYTVFGETVEGLDVIDKIAAVQTDRRDRPVAQVKIISIKPE